MVKTYVDINGGGVTVPLDFNGVGTCLGSKALGKCVVIVLDFPSIAVVVVFVNLNVCGIELSADSVDSIGFSGNARNGGSAEVVVYCGSVVCCINEAHAVKSEVDVMLFGRLGVVICRCKINIAVRLDHHCSNGLAVKLGIHIKKVYNNLITGKAVCLAISLPIGSEGVRLGLAVNPYAELGDCTLDILFVRADTHSVGLVVEVCEEVGILVDYKLLVLCEGILSEHVGKNGGSRNIGANLSL